MPAHPGTNDIARNHVPGRGQMPSRCMFVGEAPGQRESALRMPFVGQSGQELERYCRTAGIDLAGVYITNLAKWWPPIDFRGNQLPPTPADIARDEPELLAELVLCDPQVIVAIGAHAARYFLGAQFSTMRQCHGIPLPTYIPALDRVVPVLAALHPAAGLHSGLQEEQARIQWDFQQVGKLLRGHLPLTRADEHPNPQYERLYDDHNGAHILGYSLAGRTELSIDTEGTVLDPECVTVSVAPGQGWMIEAGQVHTLDALNSHINAPHSICTLIFHYLVHDIPVCEALGVHVELRRAVNADGSPGFRDTMNELHLLGGIEPKGLKAAEWRLCGMEADSFEDVTKESAYETSRAYLEQAFGAAACEVCYGTGKIEPYKVIDPECAVCGGSGRVPGKRADTTKQCACVRTSDKCHGQGQGCVDGLLIPAPARELDFDAATGEFRWKQPQSMAKWIKRRILGADLLNREEDGEDASAQANDGEGDDELGAGVAPYFAIRKAWRELPPERRALVERIGGRMPRVALRDVADQARVTTYSCKDSDATMRVAHKLTPRLREYGLERAARIDIAILPILARMERNGMMIDRQHFEAFHSDLQRWLAEERTKLADLAGEHNPNSKRMIGVLFRDLQLPTIKLTAGGQESTDDETLGILKAQLKARQANGQDADLVRTGIQVIDCIQTYREFQKMDSTYVLAMLTKSDALDRIHTTINYTKSVSRLSSEDPNLQNIPNPDNSPFVGDPVRNMGLRMRTGFIARPGHRIIGADYCLSPETPVLTADLVWKRVEDIKLGEELIGFDEELPIEYRAGYGSSFRGSRVTSLSRGCLPCYRVVTTHGEVIASDGHMWVATPHRKPIGWLGPVKDALWRRQWIRTKDLRVGYTLTLFSKPWEVEHSYDAGWMAGFLDGEGYLSTSVGFAQNEGATLDRMLQLMLARGFDLNKHKQAQKCKNFQLRGMAESMRLIGTVRPVRLLAKSRRLWDGRRSWSRHTTKAKVLSVEYVGRQPIVAIGTATKTLIAGGFLSHNSSIELVVGAHLTQDRNLMRIFREGLDPHSYAASQYMGIPIAEVPKPVRTQMKPVNFGAFYDASAMTLQRQYALMQPPIDKTEAECSEILRWYFSDYAPDVLAWKDKVRRDAQADGVVRTMFGRMRWMPGLRSQIKRVKSAAERECTNFPVQGSARDILCIGMALLWEQVYPALWAAGIDAQPIMTVHDEVLTEAPAEHAELVGWMIAETMRTAVELSVPVKVSVGIGDNWAEAH